jgi:hypothetical protein
MNIKELKEIIQELPDDMEVILSNDEEGSFYFPAQGFSDTMIYDEGNVRATEMTAEENGFESEEEFEKYIEQHNRALILYP